MLRELGMFMAGLLLFTAVGCGGPETEPPVPVSGKITFKGKPVDGAQVTFLSKAQTGGRSASGRTGADGTFKLTTFKTDDGALPGEYAITVSKSTATTSQETDVAKGVYGADYGAMMDAAAKGTPVAEASSELPVKYASAAESGLARSVAKDSVNDFEINLE
jgi:hypothetical protein